MGLISRVSSRTYRRSTNMLRLGALLLGKAKKSSAMSEAARLKQASKQYTEFQINNAKMLHAKTGKPLALSTKKNRIRNVFKSLSIKEQLVFATAWSPEWEKYRWNLVVKTVA